MMKLKDKVVFITGGAGGIGRGMALAMAKEGARIAIVDINEETGQKTVEELRKWTEAIFIQANLMDHAALPSLPL